MSAPRSAARPLVLVTGLSGAGKASILRVLEDLGFESVDNPPLGTLEELVGNGDRPLAAGVDTRTRGFSPDTVLRALERLRLRPDLAVSLVYATADDATLLRRYTETRRRHPLASGGNEGAGRVADGIGRERGLMAPLREAADLLVDTTDLPSPELRRLVERRFRPKEAPGLAVAVQSFAFPRGLPRDADLVFDLRFLRNPHYDRALRPLTGLDRVVADYVEADPDFPAFWTRLTGFLDPLLPRYVAEGKKYLTVALGCTGGRHRSVLAAERLAAHFRRSGWQADATHRELSPGTGDAASTGHRAERRDPPISEAPSSGSENEGREALSRIP